MHSGLSYLSGLRPWGGKGDFSLASIKTVMGRLGNPQDSIKSIHVAGTNGKGSVSAGIASVLGAAGFSVALTISPHLARINERIVIDGVPIGDGELSLMADEVRLASSGIELSFFEAITATFFLTAATRKVDYMVVETGLGGRLDATNVISRPEVSCITSIDFDHVAILGDTLPKIAAEKAGIIKSGSLAVVGEVGEDSFRVINDLSALASAKLYGFGRDFSVSIVGQGKNVGMYNGLRSSFKIEPKLQGPHQIKNMALVCAVGELLGVNENFIKSGIGQIFWPGRLESFYTEGKEILIDAAHNPHGVRALAEYLTSRGVKDARIVFGVLDTKEWREMVKLLSPFFSSWILVTPNSDRAVPLQSIKDQLSSIGVSDVTETSAQSSVDLILEQDKARLTVVSGSIYLIGGIRQAIVSRLKIIDSPIWTRISLSKS